MVKKRAPQNATSPPPPASNPWDKQGITPAKGGQSGTSTPKGAEQTPGKVEEKSAEQPQVNTFDVDEIRRLFKADAKKALDLAGPEALVILPDDKKGPKQASGRKREYTAGVARKDPANTVHSRHHGERA
jgi:hypothetical protein